MIYPYTKTTMIDWKDRCTPVKDQGSCGSCTAFGSLGALETLLRIKYAVEKDLSEEYVFFFSGGTCDEGNTVEALLDQCLKWIPTEKCCPYSPCEPEVNVIYCKDFLKDGAKITEYKTVIGAAAIREALLNGPVVGVMDVHESFLHYKSGIYHSLGPQDPLLGGHCVTIIGYDDSVCAWIVRNSWGTGWGMKGYVYIKYGDSDIDTIAYVLTPSLEVPNLNSKCSNKFLSFLRTLFRRFL